MCVCVCVRPCFTGLPTRRLARAPLLPAAFEFDLDVFAYRAFARTLRLPRVVRRRTVSRARRVSFCRTPLCALTWFALWCRAGAVVRALRLRSPTAGAEPLLLLVAFGLISDCAATGLRLLSACPAGPQWPIHSLPQWLLSSPRLHDGTLLHVRAPVFGLPAFRCRFTGRSSSKDDG